MRSFCMFREDVRSPIFESHYNLFTGTIDNVPLDKFECKLPSYFSTDYQVPVNYSLHLPKEYYIMALTLTNGLVAFNFYDVGVTVISKSGVFVMLLEGCTIKSHENVSIEEENVFKYDKFPIGVYKTVVRQLDVPQTSCYLLVDSNGNFLTDQGLVTSSIKEVKERTIDELNKMPGIIPVYREGFDGMLMNSLDEQYKFKVKDNKVYYTKL